VRFFIWNPRGWGGHFAEGVKMAAYDRIITVDMDLSISLDFIPGPAVCWIIRIWSSEAKSRGSSSVHGPENGQQSLYPPGRGLAAYQLSRLFHRGQSIPQRSGERYLEHIDDHTFYVVEMVYRASRDGCRLLEVPVNCMDMRGSRFNLLNEGIYKFGNLFQLWLKTFFRNTKFLKREILCASKPHPYHRR
jgi:hypothetical protein